MEKIPKILAFAASPRRGGNTEILLNKIIEGMRSAGADVEMYRTHDLNIQPCSGCGECEKLGRCVINDEFQDIFDRLIACDGIVFASPLYFMNVPARGKALIDRCQAFWSAKKRLKLDLFNGRKRFGLLVSCSGARTGPGGSPVFRGIEDTMTYVFDALGAEMMESLLFPRIDKKGIIADLPGALEQARLKGIEIASLIKGQV